MILNIIILNIIIMIAYDYFSKTKSIILHRFVTIARAYIYVRAYRR